MSIKAPRNDRSEVPGTGDVENELEHLVDSAAFRAAPRLASFLRFVVETELAGRGDRIKGYTIGSEALGRGENFDPQTDPIVRVEAVRLRRALARYYAGEGARNVIMIEMPRGSYVPLFRTRRADSQDAASAPMDVAGIIERLIGMRRVQVEAMAAEVDAARQVLDLAGDLLHALGAAACRPSPPLLPTAPPATGDAARPPDGRHEQQIQQAQGASAARPR